MQVLLTALGSYGDVHPMIGLGAAMLARGHDVVLVANPHFRDEIVRAGLRFAGVSTAAAYDELTSRGDLWHPRRGLGVVFRHGAVGILDELYDSVAALAEREDTVVGAHGLDLASRVAAERLGTRVLSVVYAPMALWSDAAPPRQPFGVRGPRWLCRAQFRLGEWATMRGIVGGPLNRLRRRVGLAPLGERFFAWYYRVAPPLCLFPSWFAADPGDWPAGTATTGFPLWDGGDAPLTAEVERFLDSGPPPIAFTPGSANRHAARFFASAVGACERLGRRGVLLTKYADQLPERLPPSVLAAGFTPLSRLLPRVAAFAHHGGVGSAAQALAAGRPQLIQPYGFDQFDNAARLASLGVAEEVPPGRFTAESAAAALDRLTADEAVATRCGELAALCDAETALDAACRRLEQHAGQ